MARRNIAERVLRDDRILARPDGRQDKILGAAALDPSRILHQRGASAPPATGTPAGPGAPAIGSVLWEGSYVPGGEPRRQFTVRLGRERTHPVPSHEFETAFQARAEAAASNKTCAVSRSGSRYRVFETDQPRGFLPRVPREMSSSGWVVFVESMHGYADPGRTYLSAAEEAVATADEAEKARRLASILREFFDFGADELHIVQQDRYRPGVVNIDINVYTLAGRARFVDETGGSVALPVDRTSPLPSVAYSITHVAFDPRSRLVPWGVLVHEEHHVRTRKRALDVLREWRSTPASSTTFYQWLAWRRTNGGSAGSARISDELWLMIREFGGDIPYRDAEGTPVRRNFLSECIGALAGFFSIFHNLALDDFRKPDGSLPEGPIFDDLDYTEEHWTPSYWDAAVPGFSTRLIKRWARYISSIGAAHRDAVVTYLRSRPVREGDDFHPKLAKALAL
jgi:hypothetical protein